MHNFTTPPSPPPPVTKDPPLTRYLGYFQPTLIILNPPSPFIWHSRVLINSKTWGIGGLVVSTKAFTADQRRQTYIFIINSWVVKHLVKMTKMRYMHRCNVISANCQKENNENYVNLSVWFADLLWRLL